MSHKPPRQLPNDTVGLQCIAVALHSKNKSNGCTQSFTVGDKEILKHKNKNTNSESSLVQAIQNTKSIKSTLYCDFDKIRSQLASVCVHLVILIHFLLRFKSKWQQPLLPGSFTSFHTLMNIPCSQPSSFCFSFKLPCSMHKLFIIPICFIYKSFVMSIYYKERQSSTDLNWKGICVRLVKLDDVTR